MFSNKKIWVNWKFSNIRGGKQTKVPYQTNGKMASSTDPTTWETYEKVSKAKGFDGVGIILGQVSEVIGIDFDKCVEDGKIKNKTIEKFVKKSKTYTEISPSGTGLHLLFHCKEQVDLESNKHHITDSETIEIYTNGRYFTFTNDRYEISAERPREVTPQEFDDLIRTLGYPWKQKTTTVPTDTVVTNFFDDEESLLKHAFKAKNGDKLKALYAGDISDYDNDFSSADFALCQSLAFWTGKDAQRIERIWLASPLGQREKTKERKDYRERTIARAIEYTQNVYTPRIVSDKKQDECELIYSTGKNPEPLLIMENICRTFDCDEKLKGKFRLNDFSHITETIWDKSEWVNLYDGCIYEVMRYFSSTYDWARKVTRQHITDAIIAVAYRNKVNPPRDYFTSLVWDKQPRLNSWLHHAYGTPDDELHQAMGSNWLKGLVKRVMRPGCIFDEVLALESKQGWRKSTSIRELGAPWHVETTHSMDDKDFYMILAQNIIVEFSEGEIFDRSSVKKIKAEVTKTEDQFRPPYERGMLKFKRSCVFAVTTNKLELKDDTGNRRWLPVSLEKPADIEWIKANRDQLYAEAYHRAIINGETTYEYPKESLEELQASRGEWSDYDEKALLWYASLTEEQMNEGVSLHVAIENIYGTERVNRLEELQAATILRRTLDMENKNTKIDGAVLKRWFPTEKTYKKINEIKKHNDIF